MKTTLIYPCSAHENCEVKLEYDYYTKKLKIESTTANQSYTISENTIKWIQRLNLEIGAKP